MNNRGNSRAASRRAGECLSQNGNRLLLIEALLISLLFVPMYVLLDAACSAVLLLVDPVGMLPYVIMACFSVLFFGTALFFVLPTLIGFLFLGESVRRGRNPVLADLFYFFWSRERYSIALSLSARFLWKLALIATAIRVTEVLGATYLPDQFFSLLLCALLIAAELIAGVLWCLSEFPLLYLCLCVGEDEPQGESRLCQAPAVSALRFFGAFFSQILLGILTCGVLLIGDTLPRMAVAYFEYCDRLFYTAATPDLD